MMSSGRAKARGTIVKAAKKAQVFSVRPLRINDAVFMCRQRKLVSEDVLIKAGFQPKRKR